MSGTGRKEQKLRRPWVLLAAYDVSLGETSEGYVAFNVLRRIAKTYRVILVTRQNNRQRLLASQEFREACKGIYVLGFDLPRWASWWKRGSRFYGLYAYLWQSVWPLVLRSRKTMLKAIRFIHVLNFHNDSIPSSAWWLDQPFIWGPVNHNESIPGWRQELWPIASAVKSRVSFTLRRLAWRCDPLLWVTKRSATAILSAGPWVDRRLRIQNESKVIRLSQLGVDASIFGSSPIDRVRIDNDAERLLVYAGRLDWLKGVDLVLEALYQLPRHFRLLIIGKGPSEFRLRHLVKNLGLGERVEFRSPVPRMELAHIYASADLFLFPSPEVAGLAWIEALACGLPVAAFAGDTELALSAQTLPGVFLAPCGIERSDNVRSYAAVIERSAILSHDRSAIRVAALRRYGWDRMVNIITDAYKCALEKR